MKIDEFLFQLKAKGGYSDLEWSQLMAKSMSDDETLLMVYDKNKLSPMLRPVQPFAITPDKKAIKQIFVNPSTFDELSRLGPGGGQ